MRHLTGSYFNSTCGAPVSSPQAAYSPSSPTERRRFYSAAAAAAAERLVVKDASFFSPGIQLLHAVWDRTNDSRVNDVDTPTSASQRTVMRGSK